MKYKIVIAYDGEPFCGWQIQPSGPSIQEAIEKALATATHKPVSIVGAGRTDAGVHALGQVAHFQIDPAEDCKRLMRSLNGILPHSIRIISLEEVDPIFHAQKSAKGKIYSYHLCLREVILPFMRPYMYHQRHPIDLSLLEQALKQFVGTHDFTSFTNSASEGACSKNPVRTIYRIDIIPTDYGVKIVFEGNGFLYKMIRNIMGASLCVAEGKLELSAIATIFAARDRRCAPKAACANGLFLEQVIYE